MPTATIERLEKKAAKETVERARDRLGLSYADVARALGVDRRTLYRYRQRKNAPSRRVRARLEMMREIHHLLDEVFDDRQDALEWLYSSVPLVNGRRPVDLLREGELEEVLSILAGLHSGAYA